MANNVIRNERIETEGRRKRERDVQKKEREKTTPKRHNTFH